MIHADYVKLINITNIAKPDYLLINVEGALVGFDFIQETLKKQVISVISEKPEELKIVVRVGDINLPNRPRAMEIKLDYINEIEFNALIQELLKNQNRLFMLAFAGFKFMEKVPAIVEDLQNLRIFQITYCGLKTIPAFVCKLPFLEILTLHDNELQSLPIEIGEMANLLEISAARNKIADMPKEIGYISTLKILDVSGNQITNLPTELGQIRQLKFLDLSRNKLTDLPYELINLENLESLDLRSNVLGIPPEILEKTGEPKTILNYYFQISTYVLRRAEGEATHTTIDISPDVIHVSRTASSSFAKSINEIKLILVGQGSVGKTSIVQQILHGTFDQSQRKTEGISINEWKFDISQEAVARFQIQPFSRVDPSKSLTITHDSKIKLNIWDFGGQEIMHATHQFFLTKRSLYLLVLDARLTQEENRVEYWLKIIQSFGGESPVLIVGNKTDQHPLDIDRTGLQKKYPNIVGILETSAATGAGIEVLKAEMARRAEILPHVRDLLPGTWFMVKSKLEELGKDKNFITQDEYLSLCDANDVSDETSQHTLIGFLHDLGVVLHFQDDPRLEALGILNPQWVTNGVYKILNSHELFQNQGKLALPLLNNILNLPEYPSNKRLFIVDMMKKFELCYDIEPDKSFLIPDLLPKDEIYTGEWNDALAFQYHYNVLPSSIITRFIVRMNALIHKNTIWRSGVVLKYGDNTALIKSDLEERKIYVLVSGKDDTRRDLLAMIRGEFDAIHRTIAKIEVTEMVPLPNAPEAAPVDLAFLQKLASEGRESLPVQSGNQIIDLIVKEVLSRIETDGRRNITINVGGDVGGNLIAGDDNEASINKSRSEKKRKR